MILRDRDNTGRGGWLTSSDGTLEERFFHLHNWRHDVIALGKSNGTLVERVKYSAYGVATRLDPADHNGDAFIDFFDDDDFDTDYTGSNARADFDYNGTVNATDSTLWDAAYLAGSTTARGTLSTTSATTGTNNRSGYAAYQFSPATQQYHVRHRALNPLVGQWLERDPMGYHDGSDLYMYVRDNPAANNDAMGLRSTSVPSSASPSLAYFPPSLYPILPCLTDPTFQRAMSYARSSCVGSTMCPNGFSVVYSTTCGATSPSGSALWLARTCCGTCTIEVCIDPARIPPGSPHFCSKLTHELIHAGDLCIHGTCDTSRGSCGTFGMPGGGVDYPAWFCSEVRGCYYGCCTEVAMRPGTNWATCFGACMDPYIRIIEGVMTPDQHILLQLHCWPNPSTMCGNVIPWTTLPDSVRPEPWRQ